MPTDDPSPLDARTQLATLWFGALAIATAGWWLLLWQAPGVRPLFSFTPAAGDHAALLACALPDLVLLVGGGAVVVWRGWSGQFRAAGRWAFLVTGAVGYATL